MRDPGDFTIGDGGTDGGGPMCMEASDCPVRARTTVSCEDSTCVYTCATGFDDCDGDATNGCETDTTRDLDNCGACGTTCMFVNATGVCSSSVCELMECRTGFEDCDGDPSNGCEANLRSTLTCGSCDTSCVAGELCDSTGATPVCSEDCSGTICGDECVDTSTNPQRCGDCDNECPVPTGAAEATCTDSVCGFDCLAGRDDCDPDAEGCETNTTNDLTNCGGCDVVCDDTRVLTQSCVSSACVIDQCEDEYADCNVDADDGCEISLADDVDHCGACDNACTGGTICELGVCDPVRQVARGEGQGCLVRESGRVVCWGENEVSQAGVGSPRAVETAQTIVVSSDPGAADFRADFVAGGNSSTCAIDRDGELWCWGQGSRLGSGPGAVNTPFPQAVVADTDPGSFNSRTFTRLDSNEGHSCAVDDMGGVWCWGLQQNGAIPGSGDAPGARRVTLPDDAIDVAVNNGASCAALDDGTVWCWGTNGDGQLGNGATTDSATPVQVSGLTGATQLDGMWRTFCAIHDGGRLSCWGNNIGGQIGVRRTENRETTPVEVASSGVLDVWQSLFSVCWQTAGSVTCRGRNYEAQFGDGTNDPFSSNGADVAVSELDGYAGFDAGRRGGCAIRDGEAYCWGASYEGSIPRDTMLLEAPSPVSAMDGSTETGYTDVAVGSEHACAIRTGIARCWGVNGSGQLGDSTALAVAHPVDVDDLTNVVDIAVGVAHSCAIEDTGTATQAYCWGSNRNQELGSTGSSATSPRLVELAGEEVVVEAGSFHSCAIDDTGSVECWGGNNEGQAGQPPSASVAPAPLATPIDDATALALGHRHACALRAAGTVECWGANDSGQLGDGTTTNRHTAAPVMGLTGVTAIAAGSAHNCALLDSGQVRCWGSAFRGQLGGPGAGTGVPVLVDFTALPAVAIATGNAHSCAAYSDGSVRCWGGNDYYQLAAPDTSSDEPAPVVVTGLDDVTALATGTDAGFLTCALQGDASPAGSIQCWGRNEYGAAGHGTSLYYPPTRVELP